MIYAFGYKGLSLLSPSLRLWISTRGLGLAGPWVSSPLPGVFQRTHIAWLHQTETSLAPCSCSALGSELGGYRHRPSISPDLRLSLTHDINYILLPCSVVHRVPASRPHTLWQFWSLPDLVPPHLFFPSFCSFLLLLFPFTLSFDFFLSPLLARTHTLKHIQSPFAVGSSALGSRPHLFLMWFLEGLGQVPHLSLCHQEACCSL